MSHINHLRHNLQGLYLKAYSTNFDLIPNLDGTKLYSAHSLMGLVWRCFYWVNQFVNSSDLCHDKLQQAIKHTITLFDAELKEMQEVSSRYTKALFEQHASAELHVWKKRLNAWHQSTAPFLKLIKKCPQALQNFKEGAFDFKSCKPMRALQRIIDLEGLMGAPVPITLLQKMIHGQDLSEIESLELDFFVKQLEALQHEEIKLFQVLSTIVSHTLRDPIPSICLKHAAILGYKLIERHKKLKLSAPCAFFKTPESAVMKWRATMKPGVKIPYGDDTIMLGEELYPHKHDLGKIRVFECANNKKMVVLVGSNRGMLPIKQIEDGKAMRGAIEPVPFIDFLCSGKMVLVERLASILNHKWHSSVENDPFVRPLIAIIKKTIEEGNKSQETVDCLSARSLLIKTNEDGTCGLRGWKPLEKTPFKFNQLEVFLADCAGVRLDVFKFLTVESGLATQRAANAYRMFLKDVLDTRPPLSDALTANMTLYQVVDVDVWNRASEIFTLANKMSREIAEKRSVELRDVNREIFYYYSLTGTFGIFLYSEIYACIMKGIDKMEAAERQLKQ